jgi:DNA-binding transcriptional regulator LsrR (DeoR family)
MISARRSTGTAAGPRWSDCEAAKIMEQLPFDVAEQQRTRIAWLYYVEGLTQSEIADRVGLSRVRVNRELAICRERGIVQIRINAKLAPCVALERQLVSRFGLKDAVVVPTPEDLGQLPAVIGMAAGQYVSDRLAPNMSIGVAWGRTMLGSLKALERRPLQGLSVVSLIGGLTRASAINTYETASRFADLFGADCYYLAAPTFTSCADSRTIFIEQAAIGDVLDRARRIDMAMVSVGSLGPDSTIRRLQMLGDDEIESLMERGAVGDCLAHFIDAAGRLVDHPVNQRVIGLAPHDLGNVPTAILASGGPDKAQVMRAVLEAGYLNIVITDDASARRLLEAG